MATIYQKLTRKATPVNKKKRDYVMQEFSKGELHSGKSKQIVTNPRQAVAIAYSEARRKNLKK